MDGLLLLLLMLMLLLLLLLFTFASTSQSQVAQFSPFEEESKVRGKATLIAVHGNNNNENFWSAERNTHHHTITLTKKHPHRTSSIDDRKDEQKYMFASWLIVFLSLFAPNA
ncbi:MAG: hypothetical protein BYD32DRAFT_451375 [Podila humilis]|nr:MAG: hypothetical protein BYD32DRAFT_451375 [Podila humilis]